MKKVHIKFDPYKMKSAVIVDNKQIQQNKHCDSNLKNYLDENSFMPIQNWIDPIPRDNWKGLLVSLCEMGDRDLHFDFSGRLIDYEDVKNSLMIQNNRFKCNAKLTFSEIKYEIASDKKMKKDIADVIDLMMKKEFIDLVSQSTSKPLKTKYKNLKKTYEHISNEEFRIVFTGTYSSGKSSIINALIGKNILPTASSTCTSTICKIKHEPDMNMFARIEYMFKNEKVVYICDSETEVHTHIKSADDSVEFIEVFTNLSKLYPENLDNTIKLVLIDTPGTDSALGNDHHKTRITKERLSSKSHLEVTKEILKSKQKEMIILVSDDKFEDDNIVELLDLIEESASADDGAYNDRFLFAMNMCDSLTYSNEGETIKNYIENFISNIKKIPHSNKLRNIVNPRVFPVTSGAALAVHSGYTQKPAREEKKTKKAELFNYYEDFTKKIYYDDLKTLEEKQFDFDEINTADPNYCLEKHSSISLRIKKMYESKLEESIPLSERVHIHSGVPALEKAIHEYMSHFAYPIKVRNLLESFSDILLEIDSYNSKEIEELERSKKYLESTRSLQELKDMEKKEEEEKEFQLRVINEKITEISYNIDLIRESIPEINELRAHLFMLKNSISEKGIKEEMEEVEGRRVLKEIIEEVERVFIEIRETVIALKLEKKEVTEKFHQELMNYITELRKIGVFQDGEFSLEDTVTFQEIINKDSFRNPGMVNKAHYNPNKKHIELGLDLGKMLTSIGGAWKTRKEPAVINKNYILVQQYIDETIDPLQVEIDQKIEEVKENYKNDIQSLKRQTKERLQSVEKLVRKVKGDIDAIRKEAEKIAKDSDRYVNKISELHKRKSYLESLINKIEYINLRG